VIMITAFGSIDTTIEAMRAGAYTYITKPLRIEEMFLHVEQALRVVELEEKISHLSTEIENQYNYYGMIGKSAGMERVFSLIEKVKDSAVSVLISGESGSGKELVARAIHYSGPRKGANFVAINCAAIPENLLEDEMFGHVKGAFTGAISNKKGRFAQADNGTIFLDEIGDMPLAMQAKLLRVLQEKRFSPIGGEEGARRVQTLNMVNAEIIDKYQLGNSGKTDTDPADTDPPPGKEPESFRFRNNQ